MPRFMCMVKLDENQVVLGELIELSHLEYLKPGIRGHSFGGALHWLLEFV